VAEDDAAGTGIAIISVDAQAQNCITVIAGANFMVGQQELAALGALPEAPRVLLLQLEVPMAVNIAAAKSVKARGGIVILDPAPAPAKGLPAELMQLVDVITPNEVETAALTGIIPGNTAQAEAAAVQLHHLGVQQSVIKMGALGAYWRGAEGAGHVPRFTVNAIDTVAAGDCFNGGLAVALAEGKSLGEAVRFASACGALSTTRRGAASAAPSRAEVEALLAAGH
jgi:ribokinase